MRQLARFFTSLLAIASFMLALGSANAAGWGRVQAVLTKVQRHIMQLSIKAEALDKKNESISRGVSNITRRRGKGSAADVRTAQFLLDRLTAMDAEGGALKAGIQRRRAELSTFQQRIDLAFPNRRADLRRFFNGLNTSQRKADRACQRQTRRSNGLKKRLASYLQTYAGSVSTSLTRQAGRRNPAPMRMTRKHAGRVATPASGFSSKGKNIYQMAAEAAAPSSTGSDALRENRMKQLLNRYRVSDPAARPSARTRPVPTSRIVSKRPSTSPSNASLASMKANAARYGLEAGVVINGRPAASRPYVAPVKSTATAVKSASVAIKRAPSKPAPVKPKPAPVKPKPAPVKPKPAPVKPKPAPVKPAAPAVDADDDSDLDEFLELDDEASLPRPRRTRGIVRLKTAEQGGEGLDLFADRIEAELQRQLGEGKAAYFSKTSTNKVRSRSLARPISKSSSKRRQVASRVQSIIDELNALAKD